MTIEQAVFITNIFAESHTDLHLSLWEQFKREVPVSQRSGVYGADNLSYIKWLKKQNNSVFVNFIKNDVNIFTT